MKKNRTTSEKVKVSYYTEQEWDHRILSFGRLVDIRNFPTLAGEVLLGEKPAFLGRGVRMPMKHIDAATVPAVVFWTKGPVINFIENKKLRTAIDLYRQKEAIIGLELTVTGFGGTFIETGIQHHTKIAHELKKVISSRIITPQSIVLRYDPVMRIVAPDGRVLSNASPETFREIITPFADMGIKHVETKFLLTPELLDGKYQHITDRFKHYNITALNSDDRLINSTISEFSNITNRLGMNLFTCCVGAVHGDSLGESDGGCLSADRLTNAARKLYGEDWSRLKKGKRASRNGCLCDSYWDLSGIKGHVKCGKHNPFCLYCTASTKSSAQSISNEIESEISKYLNEETTNYNHLLT